MDPYNQPGRPAQQPMQGHPSQGQPASPAQTGSPPQSAQQQPLSQTSVSTPTLRWVSIDAPEMPVSLGPKDYVLESVYNHQLDAWEVLVLVRPDESEDEEDEEDE